MKLTSTFVLAIASSLIAAVSAGAAHAQEAQRLLIKPSEQLSTAEVEALRRSIGAEEIQRTDRGGARVWSVQAQQLDETLEELRGDVRIEYAAPAVRDTAVLLSGPAPVADLSPRQQQVLGRLTGALDAADFRVTQAVPVRFNTTALDAGFNADQTIGLELLDGEVVELKRTNADAAGPVWEGVPVGDAGGATLVAGPQGITGTVQVRDQVYSIHPIGGGQQTILRVRDLPPDHPPSYDELESSAPEADAAPQADAAPRPDGCMDEEAKRVDVFVAYTRRVREAIPDVASLIAVAVSETNRSYANSGIGLEARLVGSTEVAYTEVGFDADLAALRSPSDSRMDEIHALRDETHADVVVLITDRDEFCGLASAIPASTDDEAFAVVSWRCATGYYSFAHEIGHLQGARHDAHVDPTPTPFPHGHGYFSSPTWRTVMAYATGCGTHCTRIDHWSNPGVTYLDEPTGRSGEAENFRVLTETAATVGRFRCAGSSASGG